MTSFFTSKTFAVFKLSAATAIAKIQRVRIRSKTRVFMVNILWLTSNRRNVLMSKLGKRESV